VLTGVCEELRRADGGAGFAPVSLKGSDDGKVREAEIGHGPGRRANVERVAGGDEDDVQAVALVIGKQEMIVERNGAAVGDPVFRRGALATGHLTDFKTAGGFGRHATLEFTFDTATAVDGRQIPVTGEIQQIKGGRTADQLQSISRNEMAVGFLVKDADILVRAGTEYDLEVSTQSLIQTGAN
jgi:hypothetical protein